MVRRRQHDEEAGSSSGGSRKRTRASRVKAEETPNQEVLERGKLFFFYRPKVGVDEVASEADIQRTYIEMAPEGEHHMIRLLLMPRKHLPKGYLSGTYFPIWMDPQQTGAVVMVPAAYWPATLTMAWDRE